VPRVCAPGPCRRQRPTPEALLRTTIQRRNPVQGRGALAAPAQPTSCAGRHVGSLRASIQRGAAGSTKLWVAILCAAGPPRNDDPAHREKRKSWYLGRCSKASALCDDQVGARQPAIAEDLLATDPEIGPLSRRHRASLGDNTCDDAISVTKFHGLSRPQPSFQAAGIAQLPNIQGRHATNVPHYVPHCQEDSGAGGYSKQ
jgi:hypothetical protein